MIHDIPIPACTLTWHERLLKVPFDHLPQEERDALEGHLALCDSCAAFLAGYQALGEVYRRQGVAVILDI